MYRLYKYEFHGVFHSQKVMLFAYLIGKYKNLSDRNSNEDITKYVSLKSYLNKDINTAINELSSLNLVPIIIGDGNIIVEQYPKKYSNTGMDQDDLISIGTVGLIKAIDTYSSDRSTRLGTYAARCIENDIYSTRQHLTTLHAHL